MQEAAVAGTRAGFLFPRAMQVPGPTHIVYLVLPAVEGQGEWLDGWHTKANAVLQWFGLEHHRNAIAYFFDSEVGLPEEAREVWNNILGRRPEKFAG